jgi:hypothetical protein
VPAQVDIHCALELVPGDLVEGLDQHPAGIVDQGIHPSVPFSDSLEACCDLVLIRNITGKEQAFPPLLVDPVGNLLTLGKHIPADDGIIVLCKHPQTGGTNAACTADDATYFLRAHIDLFFFIGDGFRNPVPINDDLNIILLDSLKSAGLLRATSWPISYLKSNLGRTGTNISPTSIWE